MTDMRLTELFNKSDAKSLNEFMASIDDDTLKKASYFFNKTRSLDKAPEKAIDQLKELRKKKMLITESMNAYISNDITHLYIELCSKDKDLLENVVEHYIQVMSLRIRLSIEMMIRKGLCTLIKEDPEDKWNPFANDTYKIKGSLTSDEHRLSTDGGDEREMSFSELVRDVIKFNHKQKEEYDDGFKITSNNVIEYIIKSKLPKN